MYFIDGKEHQGHNGTPKTWWLYYSDQLPEGTTPPIDSEHWEPFHDWIERLCWEIKIKTVNTSKYKWDEWRFSHHTHVEMWCNKKHIYSFTTRDLEYALARVAVLKVQLAEHPFSFFEQEKENGRKIWYYNLPATVRVNGPGKIGIVPDYEKMDQKTWWSEYRKRSTRFSDKFPEDNDLEREHFEETRDSGYINWGDALSDGNIWWFRD